MIPEGAAVSQEESALAAELAAIAPPGFWLGALDLFAAVEMDLRQPVDARLQVELCLLRLLRPGAQGDTDGLPMAVEARLTALERAVQNLGGADRHDGAAAAGPAVPAASGDGAIAETAAGVRDLATVEGWQSEWSMLIEAVSRANASLAGVLRDCKPLEAGPGRLVIGTNHKFHFEQISDAVKARIVTDAAEGIAGHPVAIEPRFTGATGAPEAPSGAVSDLAQAVLETFAGSRVTATRLRDAADPGAGSARGG